MPRRACGLAEPLRLLFATWRSGGPRAARHPASAQDRANVSFSRSCRDAVFRLPEAGTQWVLMNPTVPHFNNQACQGEGAKARRLGSVEPFQLRGLLSGGRPPGRQAIPVPFSKLRDWPSPSTRQDHELASLHKPVRHGNPAKPGSPCRPPDKTPLPRPSQHGNSTPTSPPRGGAWV